MQLKDQAPSEGSAIYPCYTQAMDIIFEELGRVAEDKKFIARMEWTGQEYAKELGLDEVACITIYWDAMRAVTHQLLRVHDVDTAKMLCRELAGHLFVQDDSLTMLLDAWLKLAVSQSANLTMALHDLVVTQPDFDVDADADVEDGPPEWSPVYDYFRQTTTETAHEISTLAEQHATRGTPVNFDATIVRIDPALQLSDEQRAAISWKYMVTTQAKIMVDYNNRREEGIEVCLALYREVFDRDAETEDKMRTILEKHYLKKTEDVLVDLMAARKERSAAEE